MTPAATQEREIVAQDHVEIAPVQELLFRSLNEAFGEKGWSVNRDLRFCTEIECHPIDIFAAPEHQEVLLPRIAELQAKLSRDLNIQVYFVLTSPE